MQHVQRFAFEHVARRREYCAAHMPADLDWSQWVGSRDWRFRDFRRELCNACGPNWDAYFWDLNRLHGDAGRQLTAVVAARYPIPMCVYGWDIEWGWAANRDRVFWDRSIEDAIRESVR